MLKLRSNFNGFQRFNVVHGFRHLLLYSTSSSISVEGNPEFVNYLVESLGLPTQHALSTSTKLARVRQLRGAKNFSDFNFVDNADSVVKYLKKIGLEHSHIRKAVVSVPQILLCNVNRTLIPKTQAIEKLGISGSDFAEVVSVNPSIFVTTSNTNIVSAIKALREVTGSDLHVIAILKKLVDKRFVGNSKYLVANVALLRNYGIPDESIRKYLLRLPSALVRETEYLEDAMIRVEEKLGISRNSPQFLLGLHLLSSHNEKAIQSKRETYMSFGWTESDVAALFRKNPPCFGLSIATIKKKLGFLMNELGYEPNVLILQSCLLTYSLEKRTMLRHKVLLVLKEKGFIKMDYRLSSVLSCNEARFLERFVLPFKEVHQIYSKHTGLSLEALTQRSLEKISNPV
ncbi:uncharacterized protein [Spinacia oleracea]|uniref:Uncharacterized protein n=1 Tax=Spinacia oleracea TaxID=3562 RepID=A0A9R0IMB4_SPIOL|nr:uncharacterized protein LOC110791462 [Spinacia oleracea]